MYGHRQFESNVLQESDHGGEASSNTNDDEHNLIKKSDNLNNINDESRWKEDNLPVLPPGSWARQKSKPLS